MSSNKSDLTLELERDIWERAQKLGTYACFEVTIASSVRGRVDYLTYNNEGIWCCYEIKSSCSDFYSKSVHTFLGHYNYYVLPAKLYEQVKGDIPLHVGVYNHGNYNVKRAKKQPLGVDEQVLKDSMIRSLYREAEKIIKSENPHIMDKLRRQLNRSQQEAVDYKRKYWDVMRKAQAKYGNRWYKD